MQKSIFYQLKENNKVCQTSYILHYILHYTLLFTKY